MASMCARHHPKHPSHLSHPSARPPPEAPERQAMTSSTSLGCVLACQLATSYGQESMSLTAWRGTAPTPKASTGLGMELDDDEGSPFPAQCTFEIVEEFAPVPESEFRHILEYTERQRFKFK